MTVFMLLFAIVFVAACSSSSSEDETTTPAAETSAEESKELVNLSFWAAPMAVNAPIGAQDDPVAKEIEKQLNIKLDMETKSTDEKLAALLATGDLKDIMVVNAKYAPQLKDLVIDLEPLIESHGPDIKANVDPEIFERSKREFGDGKLLFLSNGLSPENVNPENIWAGPYFRWDYYKELGYPAINTPDDFVNVVAAMKKKYPKNEDGKPYYGFSLWMDWGWGFLTDHWNVRRDGAEVIGDLAIVQIDRDTFETANKFFKEDSGFWKDLDFWNKANKAGLIDPDSWTQKYDQADQKYKTGQVLASYISWMVDSSTTYLQSKKIYDKGWNGGAPAPMPGDNYYKNNYKYGINGMLFAISKNAKNPERAMELINWFYSKKGIYTVMNGPEGGVWKEENGEFKITDMATFIKNNTEPDAALKYGYGKYLNQAGFDQAAYVPGTTIPADIRNTTEYQQQQLLLPENALKAEIAQYYNVTALNQILPAGQQFTLNKMSDINGFMPTKSTDDIKLIADKINNYLNQQVVKIVLADDFAAIKKSTIEELKKMEADKVYAFWADAVAKAKEQVKAAQ
jgi:ABC-type glycerol-3-phosphate transport system substrate-binding protein